MKLTKAQIEYLSQRLTMAWGYVKLKADGDEITLRVERAKSLRYRIVVYINGEWKGAWVSGKNSHPEQKWLNKRKNYLYSPTAMKKWEKLLGKREAAKMQKEYFSYDLSFASGKAALQHINRVATEVTILATDDLGGCEIEPATETA
ncbi:hypothetical protein LIN78_02050 [Leeia sp. TBRC 13508]|uniref:Uncharacterized protein n=1 Tax=Leeia speluncae TaxID=2884804 RepID=A0ABS8D2X1_9NEIS|nr:hypothetical protein [Leeia speluncae]MCB6182338.1 hypothetical protein [Leeia speluncae]